MSASESEPTQVVYSIKDYDMNEILADIRERYDDPIEAFPYDDATELVNAAQALEPCQEDERVREEFEEMLEDFDDEYISSWWTNEEGGEVIFYGAWRDPDNEDAWISRAAYEDDNWTAEEEGFR